MSSDLFVKVVRAFFLAKLRRVVGVHVHCELLILDVVLSLRLVRRFKVPPGQLDHWQSLLSSVDLSRSDLLVDGRVVDQRGWNLLMGVFAGHVSIFSSLCTLSTTDRS